MRQMPAPFLKILNRNPETLHFWLHLINQIKVRYILEYLDDSTKLSQFRVSHECETFRAEEICKVP